MANAIDGGNRTRASRAAAAGRSTGRAPEPAPRSAETVGAARSILRGELQNLGLPTLLTILDMERRSGLLLVQRERMLGRLFVREGRVVRARLEGARRGDGAGSGAEAVYQMLGWPEGQFELWQAEVEGGDEVGQSTTYLLMEAARRADEAQGIEHEPVAANEAW